MNEMTSPAANETVRVLGGIEFTHGQVHGVVDDFYTRIQSDPVLSVPFRSVHDWPEHIARLTHFWWTRFGGDSYMDVTYDPVTKHFAAGFNKEFLDRWLSLFHATFESHLNPRQIEFWTLLSTQMGMGLHNRNEFYRRQQEGKTSS